MTRHSILATTIALAAACMTCPAFGTIDFEIVSVDNTALLSGYETSDLQITTDDDWTAGALLLELTSGSIYQHVYGGNTPTTNGYLLSLYPELAFDTSVSTPGGTTAGAGGDVGGDAFAFSTSELDVSFYNIDDTDIGTFSVGRITLSDDAEGTWHLKLIEDVPGFVTYEFSGSIADGIVSHESSSPFNGMTQVEVGDFQSMQYQKAIGIQFDDQGNKIPTKWSWTLGQETPVNDPLATLPEPHTLALFGIGLATCLSGRKR